MNEESTMVVEKSTHKVEVIRINELLKHDNADSLSLVKIYDYTCVVRTSDWKAGVLAAWIPPDSIVDTKRPEFAFMASKAKTDGKIRIRTQKLRGVVSYGLLVPAPDGLNEGDDAATVLGVEHYDPEVENVLREKIGNKNYSMTGGEVAKPPRGTYPKYDVDAFMKYARVVFTEGELVVVTEKIHGSNARYVHIDDEFHRGSRDQWKKEYASRPDLTYESLLEKIGDEEKAKQVFEKINNWTPKRNMWWQSADTAPGMMDFCKANPGYTVYGETYGNNSGYLYDTTPEQHVKFRAFDILCLDGSWMDFPYFLATCKAFGIPHVPVIHEAIPFNFDEVVKMAEGMSLLNPKHIREGVVVHPVKERWHPKLGRVKLKVINPEY
ncbi:hypothetical protein C4577_07310 [Candidatus Parcubacteria bacterium]|nr:MAG: hypothetical protein C4577_07310 [Candidatus Parcubacteria bacterium]